MQHMKFVRFCIKFKRASTHDLENLTTAPSKESECVRIKEIQLADGDCSLPLICAEKHCGSNTIIQYEC